MKVAVTGASGFVGRHLIAELRSRNVTVFDERLDIKDRPADAFQRMGSPDVLIHLAWGGLPNYKSAHHLDEELPAQYKFLESVVRAGVKNVLVTGTCFEYGMQSGALGEEREPRPVTPYSIAKDALRRRLGELQTETPFELTWARLFFLYGDGQAEGSLLPQVRRAVERGDELFNMSGGEQLRDYLPVEVAVGYLVSLALNGENNGIVNICSGKPISVRALVEKWIRDNEWPIRPNLGFYPYADYEPMEFWGDRSKLDRLLLEGRSRNKRKGS